jgi:hypothetical protein
LIGAILKPECIIADFIVAHVTEDVFEDQTHTCEAQPHIVSECNEDDGDEEDYYKDIDEEEATQYEEDEQPSETDIEVGCTSRRLVC